LTIRVDPFWHLLWAADTAIFASSEGLAYRETLFGTGAERLTPVFCSIATHAPMIRLERHILAGGAIGPDMAVAISCDLCGRMAAEQGLCDPDDATAAEVTAEWLRTRQGWGRSGRLITCRACRRRPPRGH
jgi:hypothetical protein